MTLKKILIVISDISKSGGTERAALNLANMLSEDYTLHILSLHNTEAEISTFYKVDSSVVLQSAKLNIEGTLKNTVSNFSALRKIENDLKPDFIIGTWYGVNILLPFFKNKKTKVIACEHADFNTTPKIIKLIAKLSYPRLNAVAVLSDLAKEKMKNYSNNIVVLPNSLPFTVEEKSDLRGKRILMVGRLVQVKGYERVIPLAKYLMQHFPEWKIDIFGDGDIAEDLLKAINKNKIRNISIHKSVKNIEKEYLDSSIYLSTSYNEAMPMTFIEAMSCGLPILSYRNEGAECLVDQGLNGFLVENSDELIKKCKMLIESKELREEVGKKALEKSDSYKPESIKQLWLSVLQNKNL